MKQTLSRYDIANALHQDEYAGWSYEGALALADYFQDYEDSIGEEMELNVVAIRCEFSEYPSLAEWAINFGGSVADMADDGDDDIRNYIQSYGILIEFDGGIIVSDF